jgi:hypothetical protein
MDDLPDGDLVVRPAWPLSDWGGRRIRYGRPLMMVSGAAVLFATTRWVSVGMPLALSELNEVVAALWVLGLAIAAAIYFEGTTIAANRERVVVTRWFQVASILPVADLASLTRSTVQVRGYRRRIIDSHRVSFITQGAQCVLIVNWDRFTDDDLDQLSKVTGVRLDGGWFYKRAA